MKKFMKQFEGLRVTERGDTVLMLMFSIAFVGILLGADFAGGVA